ncbi:peptide chain release factor N(5)-glutamine methyltransferase [Halovulum sp. GXIMD14794]
MTETLAQAQIRATALLREAGVPDPARDARALLAHAAELPADRLGLERDRLLDEAAATRLEQAVAERARLRPVAQIIGRRCFWGRDFLVSGDVLDPRPETETIIALALEQAPASRVLDLGTGSGILALTMLAEWPGARALAVDRSAEALDIAQRNAQLLGVGGRVELRKSDWFHGVEGAFDLILSNPPYIPEGDAPGLEAAVRQWEPNLALFAGSDGLDAYRAIARDIAAHLAPQGRALLEHGAGQADDVAAIFREAGDFMLSHHRDMAGKRRVIEVTSHS